MKRLTKRCNGVVTYIGASNEYETGQIACEVGSQGVRELLERVAAYEDTGCEPEQIAKAKDALEYAYGNAERIIKLAEADRDGRLVVLPCKVGDVVYGFHGSRTILPMEVKWVETNTNGWDVAAQYAPMAPKFYQFSDFGKTVFLTHEEAEKALEATKGK